MEHPDTKSSGKQYFYRVPTKVLEPESGLGSWHDYGFRWYDPAVGRFPSVDPLAEPQASYSPYHYVYDNPILFIDRFGLYGEKKAKRKQRRATKKYGEDRVTDVYFNKEKGEYGFMVYGEGKNKYTHITKGEKGELQASASKGYAIYGKKDLRSFKRKEGLFTPFYVSANFEWTFAGGVSFEIGYIQDRFGGRTGFEQ